MSSESCKLGSQPSTLRALAEFPTRSWSSAEPRTESRKGSVNPEEQMSDTTYLTTNEVSASDL